MNNAENRGIPELLAPAGNLACALTAYDNGADAVYAGVGQFNAREMNKNFSFEDMSRLSAYAKKKGKRFYVTLNTLIKEQELSAVGQTMAALSDLDPDAFIVQDLGVLALARDYFPEIPVHGSTQMGIHNSAGLSMAQKLGMSRVILERQIDLKDLQKMAELSPVELEVFIHGALCCSLSGKCLFSSWLGGYSGNRGKCKQPCRRRFHTEGRDKKESGFFFSTQDLYSLDLIPLYKEWGINSLKIEGRLKKPDYVKNVVTAYRMMLDVPSDRQAQTLSEARNVLAGTYGRRWSHGFAAEADRKELIQHKSLGVSGLLAGHVTEAKRAGFEVNVTRRLHLGDRLRVQDRAGNETPSFTITKLFAKGQSIKTAVKGQSIFIPYDRSVKTGSLVYKVGEAAADLTSRMEAMPLYVKPANVDVKVEVSAEGLRAESSTGVEYRWDQPFSPAQNHRGTESDVEAAFRVTRSGVLAAGKVDVNIEGDLFLPAGVLKKARRAFWERVAESAEEIKPAVFPSEALADRLADGAKKSLTEEPDEVVFSRSSGTPRIVSWTREAKLMGEATNPSQEIVLPFFADESELEAMRFQVRNAYEAGHRRFRITDLFQLDLFEGLSEAELVTSFPLPVTNSMAAGVLKELGVSQCQLWVELEREAWKDAAAHSPVAVEQYIYGRPILLATRASVPVQGPITDSRGQRFSVVTEAWPGITAVYPGEPMSVEKLVADSYFYDCTQADGRKERSRPFNFDYTLL